MKRILVLKLHALGDMIIHTPAFKRLRLGFPDAEITMLTTEWAEPAIRNLPFFDRIWVAPSNLFFGRGYGRFWKLAKLAIDLRSRKYDAIVSFHRSNSISRFLSLSTLPATKFEYGYQTSGNRIKLDEDRHSAPNAIELSDLAIERLGGVKMPEIQFEDIRYIWQVTVAERETADQVLRESGLSDSFFAVLFPGGGSKPNAISHEKRWGPEKFAEVADWLATEADLKVLLMGSQADNEICNQVRANAVSNPIDVSGRFDMRTTSAILARSKLVISNDSAPLHASAAIGAPTIGVFGPTGMQHKLPPGQHCRGVALGLPCSPCYYSLFNGCIFSSFRCMEDLQAARVIEVSRSLLASQPVSHRE